MQEEMFGYTEEEIDIARKSLADDVIKLRSLEEEKSGTNKSYTKAIRILKLSIAEKAIAIRKANRGLMREVADEFNRRSDGTAPAIVKNG